MSFRKPRHPRGFTMIELLVVIGIILVLVGIAAYAFNKLDPSEKATRASLANCKAMFAEFESTAGIGSTPIEVFTASGRIKKADPPFGDFWIDPVSQPANTPSPVVCPGLVAGNVGGAGSDAVRNTVLAMSVIQSIPANRDAVSKMPAKSLLKYSDDPSTTGLDESRFPVVADAWGNPIIFVPGNGLGIADTDLTKGVRLGQKADGTFTLEKQTIKSPDNRPFFASAGPDGDFSKGDDNIYSFDQ